LEEMDIGDGTVPRPMYVNTNLSREQKDKVRLLAHQFIDIFAWEYTKMPSLGRDLVEHRLPIKEGFKPFKQPPRNYNPAMYDRIKEEVNRLLEADFIRPCRYVEWVSNIVLVEKKNTRKIRVCIDF
jgi:hypothetical protein